MRKYLLFVLVFFCLISCAVLADKDSRVFRVGVFPLEPLNFVDSSGEASGLNTDLIKEAFKESARHPVFVPGSWNECYERLQNGEIDLMTTVALSPERQEIMDFSHEPVVLIWGQVFTSPGSGINNILDLRGKTVAIMKKDINGQNFIDTLASFGGRCNIIELATHHEVFDAVARGEAVAGVAPQHFGLRFCHEHGLVSTSIQFSPFSVFFATKKGSNKDLLEHLDRKLEEWKPTEGSFYHERLNYWLMGVKSGGIIPKWVSVVLSILVLIIGFTLYGMRIMRRLVEQKTLELANQEKDFRNLVEQANSIILRLDTDKRISFINQFGLKLLKFSADQLLGKSAYETILPQAQTDGTEIKTIIEPVFSDPSRHIIVENENLCGDGSRVYVRWSNRAIYDENGNFKEMLCIGNDITEQKKLERELLQTQKMEAVGRLAGGIAHDFNNILFVIVGNLDMARNRLNDKVALVKNLENVEKAAERAKNLVRQILAFSRKNVSEKKAICLADEVRDAVKMLRPTLPSTMKIEETRLSAGKILADSNQINQILMNLCTNSMHALKGEPGILKIGVSESYLPDEFIKSDSDKTRLHLKLTVSDSGHGIDPENLTRIFEPFFTTKEKFKGSGMGLAVVHGIVKEHGGEIRVFSEVGKGTTFEIFFPAVESNIMPQNLSESATESFSGTEKIMLVDDEPMILDVNSEMLQGFGYHVTAFSSSVDALRAFEKAPEAFDLIVTDMTMPEMTGAAMARKILQLKPETSVIIVTGHSDQIDRKKAAREGIAGFAYKPLSSAELLREIRRILQSRGKRS